MPSAGARTDTAPGGDMTLDRRRFLSLSGVAAASVLAGCGFVPREPDPDALTFTTWGTDAELAGFRSAIAGFEKARPGTRVALNAVPYDQMFSNLDAQFQAGNAPDVFRVPYYTLGSYAGRGQLLDIGGRVPAGFADRFTPTAWAAVQSAGRTVGVPHHTDTSVILYNRKLLRDAGITSVPTRLVDAWTWDEFGRVARQLRDSLPDSQYPFVSNWQGNGVTRWLSWLFQADGRLLTERLDKPAVDSSAGRAALSYTKSFFTSRFVPPNSSVKSTALAADTWFSQTAAMTWAGAFLLPDATSTATFDWGATFAPRDVRAASDFGGNAVVVTSQTGKADTAVAFLDHLTTAATMRDFCTRASLLPTRRDLVAEGVRFADRPELSPVFAGQASTVRPADARQVASPSMLKIITVLQDQLEQAFAGGQGVGETLSGLASGIETALTR